MPLHVTRSVVHHIEFVDVGDTPTVFGLQGGEAETGPADAALLLVLRGSATHRVALTDPAAADARAAALRSGNLRMHRPRALAPAAHAAVESQGAAGPMAPRHRAGSEQGSAGHAARLRKMSSLQQIGIFDAPPSDPEPTPSRLAATWPAAADGESDGEAAGEAPAAPGELVGAAWRRARGRLSATLPSAAERPAHGELAALVEEATKVGAAEVAALGVAYARFDGGSACTACDLRLGSVDDPRRDGARPSSFSVVAERGTQLLVLPRAALYHICDHVPIILDPALLQRLLAVGVADRTTAQRKQLAELLRVLPFFANYDDRCLAELCSAAEPVVGDESVVVRQDQPCDDVFVIVSGEAVSYFKEPRELTLKRSQADVGGQPSE